MKKYNFFFVKGNRTEDLLKVAIEYIINSIGDNATVLTVLKNVIGMTDDEIRKYII